MQAAIDRRQRWEAISFDSLDGGASYWRQIAKVSHGRVRDALAMARGKRLSGLEGKLVRAHQEYVDLVARVGPRDEAIGTAKEQLWKVWSSMDTEDPTREAIRKVWETL